MLTYKEANVKPRRNIDHEIKKYKNKSKISFSWGFEYRYLQDLSSEILNLVSSKFSMDKAELHLLRTPSVSAYRNLKEIFKITNLFHLTPELICIEGTPKTQNILYHQGTLAYLLPGQSYLDALFNLENDVEISKTLAEDVYQHRLAADDKAREMFSKIFKISKKQIAFNWGSGGSIELILWALRNKLKRTPRMLINLPNYFYTYALGDRFGFKIRSVLSYSGKNYRFPFKTLLKELKSTKFDLLVLTSPNNPFGIPIDKNQFYDLLKSLPANTYALLDFTGLSDESMFYFQDVLDEKAFHSKNIFMIDSLSKKYDMCHVRAGYIIGSNESIFTELDIHHFAPILTDYAYRKLDEALGNPSIKKAVIKKHKNLFQLLKSVENSHFQIISPHFSNFIVTRFPSENQLSEFLKYLTKKYHYYDLPFRGVGKFEKEQGGISQDFIQFLPRCYLRILEETAEFIAEAVKGFYPQR
jgi:histidinol-phosphate/aromatic aminotransferase/cobyric acid decarboxylase-like protein